MDSLPPPPTPTQPPPPRPFQTAPVPSPRNTLSRSALPTDTRQPPASRGPSDSKGPGAANPGVSTGTSPAAAVPAQGAANPSPDAPAPGNPSKLGAPTPPGPSDSEGPGAANPGVSTGTSPAAAVPAQGAANSCPDAPAPGNPGHPAAELAAPAAPPAAEAPSWRQQLRASLAALPPERLRQLRPYACAGGACASGAFADGASPTGASAELLPHPPDPSHPSQGTPELGHPTPSQGSPALLAAKPPAAPLLDLASNDYLGLSRHPAVLAAAAAELAASGLGAGASRLVTGTRPVHLELERELARWLGRERVLLFPSGFQANLAAVGALADRHSLVLADRLIHHSLLAGVRASGARLQRFAHNDPAELERRLAAARREAPSRRLLVLCESLYSMEGTSPPLAELAALCASHNAALLVDEAHALGVLGPGGRGLARGLAEVALVSGTFGKAFGSGGAFLAADEPLGEWLLQSSGAFRYTTALAPPLAAGALAALAQLREGQGAGAGAALVARAARWRAALAAAGWPRPPGEGPILPLLVGDDGQALALQARLEAAGLLTAAIRPPTVPAGTARLRLVLRQDLPSGTLARLLAALGPCPQPPASP